MKCSVRVLLCVISLFAILAVYWRRVSVQARDRVFASKHSAESWTSRELMTLDHDGYYIWVDDYGPELSVGRYSSNLLFPVRHIDLDSDADQETLQRTGR